MSNVHKLALINGVLSGLELGEGGDHILRDYTPKAPEKQLIELALFQRQGNVIKDVKKLNITETVELLVDGDYSTAADIQEKLEKFFEMTERYQLHRGGAQCYVYFRPGNTGTTWRSPVFTGSAQVGESAFKYEYNREYRTIYITWVRAYYWEDTTLTTVDGSNTVDTSPTSPTQINPFTDDTPRANYVNIASSELDGSIPAPAHIEIENLFNDGTNLNSFWVGNQIFGEYDASLVLEAEDADYYAGTASPGSNADASGSAYQTATTTNSNLVDMFRWVLSSAVLDDLKGYKYKVIPVFWNAPDNDCLLNFAVKYENLTTLWAPQQKYITATEAEMGTVQLPPWLPGETSQYELYFNLQAEKSGGTTIHLDAVYLIPMASYAKYAPRGYGLPYQSTLVDDPYLIPYASSVYMIDTSGDKSGIYIKTGDGVYLDPNRHNRLHFFMTKASGKIEGDVTCDVTIKFRKRVLTP